MTPDTAPLLVSVEGGVAAITLNRPEVLNALTIDLMIALRAALEQAAAADEVRAVLITGAGRSFCAGADLAAAARIKPALKPDHMLRDYYHPVILLMRHMPKPVISAVQGSVAGAGMSLALAADLIIAGESARFLQAFSKIGLVPDAGSSFLLPRLVGDLRARAMMMLGEPVHADQALRMGLVWQVLPDAELAASARALARRLATMPTLALAGIKHLLAASGGHSLEEQLELEAEQQARSALTEDFREGVSAFLGKRAPEFKGR